MHGVYIVHTQHTSRSVTISHARHTHVGKRPQPTINDLQLCTRDAQYY